MQTWEQTYHLPAGGGVRIEQRHGAVRVIGWEQPAVKLTAEAGGEGNVAERLSVTQETRGLSLEVHPARGRFLGFISLGDDGLDMELRVPYGTPCQIESGSGPIEVTATQAPVRIECGSGHVSLREVAGVQVETGSGSIAIQRAAGAIAVETGSGVVDLDQVGGDARVEVGSGQISARQVGGSLRAGTGSGDVAVSGANGTVKLGTGSGSIRAERVHGPALHVESGGGDIRLTGLAVDRLDVETASGDVRIELAAVRPHGSYSVESASGGVVVGIPPSADLDVEVESDSGTITHLGLDLRRLRTEPGELRATLNQGGAKLTIEAGSGNVQLRPAADWPAMAEFVASAEPPEPALKAIQGDAAVANSDQMRRILVMVEEGKLSPDEAEAILSALDEEETPA